MRIVAVMGALVATLLMVSCDGTNKTNSPVSSVTVTAAYVENGDTIVVEGTNFGTTQPTGTLTKVTIGDALTDLPQTLTVTDFSETRIAFALPETFTEGNYLLAGETANGGFTVTLVGLKGEPGEDGADGARGATGAKGDKGDKGDTGDTGIQGIQGEKGEKGDTGDAGTDGEDGLSSLVDIADEAAGANCANGGKKITTGLDDNGDGVLDAGEIDHTEYVCNGNDAACYGNAAPAITKLAFDMVPGKNFRRGIPVTLFLTATDADEDTLDITFSGMGATIEPAGDGVYKVTPEMLGGPFLFGVTVNDGCHTVTSSFKINKVVRPKTNMYAITGSNGADTYLYRVDLASQSLAVIGDTGLVHATGLAINPLDGKMYLVSDDSGDSLLYEVNPETAEVTEIGALETGTIPDIAFGPDGTLYGWTEASDNLVTIDLATGKATILDNYVDSWHTGLAYSPAGLFVKVGLQVWQLSPESGGSTYITDITNVPDLFNVLDYNYGNDLFYSIYRSGNSYLYAIDPETWEATELFDTGISDISSLASIVDAVAPAEVTDLAIDEDHSGCNYATLTWTDPADGDFDFVMIDWAPNGPTKMIVVQDGEEEVAIIEGLAEDTEYTFTVYTVDNEGNVSEGATLTVTTPECPVITAPSHPLYLLTGAGSDTKGLLYTLDPMTLETTLIGDTGLEATAGLAINPLDGKMYVTSNDTGHLYEVNPATAEVTDIGALGTGHIPDITFGADGTLYGWTENGDDLITIDLTTGAATLVGEFGLGEISWATGLAFDGDTLYVKFGYDIYTVDATTGAGTYVADFTGIISFPDDYDWVSNVLAISDNGYYYTVQRDYSPGGNSYLYVIDPNDWSVTFLGDLGIWGVSALEFDKH